MSCFPVLIRNHTPIQTGKWWEGRKKTFLQRPSGLLFMKNVGEVCGGLSPVGHLHPMLAGQDLSPLGGSSRRCDQHVKNWPQLPLPTSLGHCGDGGRELGVKLSWRRTKRWEEGIFKMWFTSHYSTLILAINEFRHAEAVLPLAVFVEWCLPVLTSAVNFVAFSFPCPAELQSSFGGHLASGWG